MWTHWKEESIKRFSEHCTTQPWSGHDVYTLSMPLFTHLVILLVTGEGITSYQTRRKSEITLPESVFSYHLGSGI